MKVKKRSEAFTFILSPEETTIEELRLHITHTHTHFGPVTCNSTKRGLWEKNRHASFVSHGCRTEIVPVRAESLSIILQNTHKPPKQTRMSGLTLKLPPGQKVQLHSTGLRSAPDQDHVSTWPTPGSSSGESPSV